MRLKLFAFALFLLPPLVAGAQQSKLYRWVDADGVVHYGDKVPAEYSELPKQVVNDHGVAVEQLAGKKTEEEIEADRVAAELEMQKELQRRADQTLMVTYQTVDEIEMHRDRRVELFQAQSRVTELYLSNQRRALDMMQREASRFKPYNADPRRAVPSGSPEPRAVLPPTHLPDRCRAGRPAIPAGKLTS